MFFFSKSKLVLKGTFGNSLKTKFLKKVFKNKKNNQEVKLKINMK